MLRLFIPILVIMALASCLKKESFPPEPAIEFKSFKTYPDSARLVLGFTDGDGNLGLNQEDTTGQFCTVGCLYYFNMFCEYYELQNGTWTHIPLDPFTQIPFYYRIPLLEPTGQNKTQQGEISVAMPAYYLLSDYDTCRFLVHVVDRSLNESNSVWTKSFIKPQ